MAKGKYIYRTKTKNRWLWPLIITILLLVAVFLAWKHFLRPVSDPDHGSGTSGTHVITRNGYSVSSCSKEASETAAKVLEAGGNAADAVVAMCYTVSVVEPYASGLGGGGCLVVYDPEADEYVFYNYGAEAAQSGAEYYMLVPGFVSGMQALLDDYGTMPYAELLAPAIHYCEGNYVNRTLATRIDTAAGWVADSSIFYHDGKLLDTGDVLIQKELGNTLSRLAEEGADSFYHGSVAADIAANTSFTESDLAAYQTVKTEPVIGSYAGYEVASAAAPYSGATLIQMLEMAELTQLTDHAADPAAFLQELQTITFATENDRRQHVYDLRFGDNTDQSDLVSQDYITQLCQESIDGYVPEEECEDTTAFAVMDKNGMVIVGTNTLSSFFGCGATVDGFFLNNSGSCFGSGVNSAAPGKRPRTYISPTILRSEDGCIAIATPGGNVIVKVLAQTLMDICQMGTQPQTAVEKQRFFFTAPQTICYESGYDTPYMVDISQADYTSYPKTNHSYFGNIALVSYSKHDGFRAVSDMRREGYGIAKN